LNRYTHGERKLSKNKILGTILSLLLTGILALSLNVQPVKASGTVYIRADGSIDPPTAPISSLDNVTYTLTDNITSDADGIVIERDNITVDGIGYTLKGTGGGKGIDLTGRINATVQNMKIETFSYGIYLYSGQPAPPAVCLNNSISGNNITNSQYGIYLFHAKNAVLRNNKMINNTYNLHVEGSNPEYVHDIDTSNTVDEKPICYWVNKQNMTVPLDAGYVGLVNCTDITVQNLTLTKNGQGILLALTTNSTLTNNNITDNFQGISLKASTNNSIYHNSFTTNTNQVYVWPSGCANVWDDGYPSGGNYWSDYAGVDKMRGPSQDQPGGDGIGDTPYVIDADNHDRYPLMKKYPWEPHDIGIMSVTTSKTGCLPAETVGQGYPLYINTTVFNYGNATETFNVTVYVNTTSVASQTVTMSNGHSADIAFTWNTTGFAYGNYTLSAYAWPVPGETDTTDNTLTSGNVYVGIPGDINGNGIVDIYDAILFANSMTNTRPGDPNWNPNADIKGDGVIDIYDAIVLAGHFNQHL